MTMTNTHFAAVVALRQDTLISELDALKTKRLVGEVITCPLCEPLDPSMVSLDVCEKCQVWENEFYAD